MVNQFSLPPKQHRRLAVYSTALLLTLGVVSPAWAAPGDLDTSFNYDGKVMLSITDHIDIGKAVAIQSDGKILVGGYGGHWALARFNPDGSVDTDFGTNGIVTTDMGLCTCEISALAIQLDGKIIAAGDGKGSDFDFALARYNTDGSLDTSFNSTGKVFTDFGVGDDFAHALVIQPDGKIVAAGEADDGSTPNNVALARYNPNGSLDTSFNTTGKVITGTSDWGGFQTYGTALARQSDGKLVVAGDLFDGSYNHIILARYNTNGSLDTSFNTTRKVVDQVNSTSDSRASAIALQGTQILIAGPTSAGPDPDNFLLGRYDGAGTRVGSFGNSSGFAVTDLSMDTDTATSLVVQPDLKLIAAGYLRAGPSDYDFALARFNPDGSLDPSFGMGGIVGTDFNGKVDRVNGLALQSDGKIVAAGTVDPLVKASPGDSNFGVARYLGDDTPPPPPAQANLQLSKSANLTTVKSGKNLTYTLKLKNNGPDTAAAVVLNDPLPAGTTFVSVSPGPTTCMGPSVGDGGTVSCEFGSLPSGNSATVTLVVKVTARGRSTITNTATLSSPTQDSNLANNTASVQTRVYGSGK